MAASDYVSKTPEFTLALKGASTDGKRTSTGSEPPAVTVRIPFGQLSESISVDEEVEIVVDEAPALRRDMQKSQPQSGRTSVAVMDCTDFVFTKSVQPLKPRRFISPVIQDGTKRLDPNAELAFHIGAERV